MKGKRQPSLVNGNNCGVKGDRGEVCYIALWLCAWSLAQITLLLCRTWKSRINHLYAPHTRARLHYWQSLNGCCLKYTQYCCILGERAAVVRVLSSDWGFKPRPDYTTQPETEVEFWSAEGGDRGRMFTAHFHIPFLEAIELCFTVFPVHTGLKG